MTDQHDSGATLGGASTGRGEESAVHHPVGPPIPEVLQPAGDRREISAAGGGEEPGGVLDDDPAGSLGVEAVGLAEDPVELPEQPGADPGQPPAVEGGPAGLLAGEPADDDVGSGSNQVLSDGVTDVTPPGDVGPVSGEDGDGVGIALDLEHTAQPSALEAEVEPADTGEEAGEAQHSFPFAQWRTRAPNESSDTLGGA
jgi:hypothetical protein